MQSSESNVSGALASQHSKQTLPMQRSKSNASGASQADRGLSKQTGASQASFSSTDSCPSVQRTQTVGSFGVESRQESAANAEALKETLDSIKSGSWRYKDQRLPWIGNDGAQIWTRDRIWLAKLLRSQYFESIMGIVILANLGIMIYETDQDALCYPLPEGTQYADCAERSDNIVWLNYTNMILLVLYSIEALARFYVERSLYLMNRWNQIDLATVLAGWVTTIVGLVVNLNFLRAVRVFRLLRAARMLISIREFYLLLSGFMSSLKAIFFGAVMLFVIVGLWSILIVQVVHPVNSSIFYPDCKRCSKGYASVRIASLTLYQQIVAGDSWGQISVPVIEKEPLVAPILLTVSVTISLGVMNLILAVIVERAAEAREKDVQHKLKEIDESRKQNMVDLARICHDMDGDENGTLSLEEMLYGCDESKEFHSMMDRMGLRREDLASVFNVLDADGSGDVSYLELCQMFDSATKRDPTMMLSLCKFSIMEVKQVIQNEIRPLLDRQKQTLGQHTKMLASIQRHLGIPELEEELPEPMRSPSRWSSMSPRNSEEQVCVPSPSSILSAAPLRVDQEVVQASCKIDLSAASADAGTKRIHFQKSKEYQAKYLSANGASSMSAMDVLEGLCREVKKLLPREEADADTASTLQADIESQVDSLLRSVQLTRSLIVSAAGSSLEPEGDDASAGRSHQSTLQERLTRLQSSIAQDLQSQESALERKRWIADSLRNWLLAHPHETDQSKIPNVLKSKEKGILEDTISV
ncbi:unnamed protein product [Polarella glacialis]|uniref:EF-hand domain-containing protein n=1 Tax=Polarella glacialis TaxID=89957 RepID=A0A813IA06_POLGL|nr:unnamed protein product [Polarella glacialis]